MGCTLSELAAVLRGEGVMDGRRRWAGLIIGELSQRGIGVGLNDEGGLELTATPEQAEELARNFESADPEFADEFRRINAAKMP